MDSNINGWQLVIGGGILAAMFTACVFAALWYQLKSEKLAAKKKEKEQARSDDQQTRFGQGGR